MRLFKVAMILSHDLKQNQNTSLFQYAFESLFNRIYYLFINVKRPEDKYSIYTN